MNKNTQCYCSYRLRRRKLKRALMLAIWVLRLVWLVMKLWTLIGL